MYWNCVWKVSEGIEGQVIVKLKWLKKKSSLISNNLINVKYSSQVS